MRPTYPWFYCIVFYGSFVYIGASYTLQSDVGLLRLSTGAHTQGGRNDIELHEALGSPEM